MPGVSRVFDLQGGILRSSPDQRRCSRCGKTAATDCVRCAACARQRLRPNRQYLTDRRRTQARLDKGQCPRCTAPLDAGCALCKGCLGDRRLARRDRKAHWQAEGKCGRCGRARDKPNVRTCARCLGYRPRYAARNRAAGMCACGDFRAARRKTCPRCREYWRRAAAKFRAKQPVAVGYSPTQNPQNPQNLLSTARGVRANVTKRKAHGY